MLVGAFEVHEGGVAAQAVARLVEHGAVARAGLEPDVEDVALLAEAVPPHFGQVAPGGTSSSTGCVNQASAPSLRKRSRKWRTVSAVRSWVAAGLAAQRGDRHAPGPLAADAPVGAAADHRVDPRLAPAGKPGHARRSP